MGYCKTPDNTFCVTLRRFVSVDWQKSGLNSKKNGILGFARWTPHQKKLNFFIIIAKVRSLPTLFMQKLYYQRIWFELYGFLNGSN